MLFVSADVGVVVVVVVVVTMRCSDEVPEELLVELDERELDRITKANKQRNATVHKAIDDGEVSESAQKQWTDSGEER